MCHLQIHETVPSWSSGACAADNGGNDSSKNKSRSRESVSSFPDALKGFSSSSSSNARETMPPLESQRVRGANPSLGSSNEQRIHPTICLKNKEY